MNTYSLDNLGEDSEAQDNSRGDRYEVTVTLTIEASNPQEAEESVNEIIMEGKMALMTQQDKDVVEEYDITDIEPADIF